MAHKIGPECIGCGACAGGCPTGCIHEDGGVYVINAAECIDCGTCAGNCPTGAIVKRGMRIPKGHMAYGIPCRIVRPITQAEYDEIRISTQEYQEYKAEYERQEQENDSLL